MIKFVESQFEILLVYEFQTKANSYEDICCVSVWSYVSLWVSNQSEFSWKHLLSLCLKLCKVMSFKEKWILVETFVESQFEVMYLYEIQTKANSYTGICWVLLWSHVSLWVSHKTDFLWRHLLSLCLRFWSFMNFKQKWILMKVFVESEFEVI